MFANSLGGALEEKGDLFAAYLFAPARLRWQCALIQACTRCPWLPGIGEEDRTAGVTACELGDELRVRLQCIHAAAVHREINEGRAGARSRQLSRASPARAKSGRVRLVDPGW